MKENPEKASRDLLGILLMDEAFIDNDTMIIDECMTFFLAGTQTTAITI